MSIVPTLDVEKTRTFFERLGFVQTGGDKGYLMLADGKGGEIHITPAVEGWLVPGRNPFALYLYVEDVDGMAARFPGEILGKLKHPEDKPWGMYEFAVQTPDETLIRIGWPTRLRKPSSAE